MCLCYMLVFKANTLAITCQGIILPFSNFLNGLFLNQATQSNISQKMKDLIA